jgi:hypothetical protein
MLLNPGQLLTPPQPPIFSSDGFGALIASGKVAPPAPTALAVTPVSSTELDLTWTDPTWAAPYTLSGVHVLRSATLGGTYTVVGSVSAGTQAYADTGLTPGTTYYYKVQGYQTSPAVLGAMSASASATTWNAAQVLTAGDNLQVLTAGDNLPVLAA